MPILSETRVRFFDFLFSEQEGYLCLASAIPGIKSSFTQRFFKWPEDSLQAEGWIHRQAHNKNLWFCINILSKPERKKEFCIPSNLVWADLDSANPNEIKPAPQIVIESSPNKFQGIWRLTMPIEPLIAEGYSKRIAYAYKDDGADPSGWDLTQLLRVPNTINFKYDDRPTVQILRRSEILAEPLLFEVLPQIPDPTIDNLPEIPALLPVEQVIYKYSTQLRNTAFAALYSLELADDADWSKHLWRLIHVCLEAGLDAQETLSVVKTSKVNKYDRDNRPSIHLWRDVLKAEAAQESINIITANFKPLLMPQLVEEPSGGYDNSFPVAYTEWASEATDAVPQFHDLCAFILLSAVIAGNVRLPTSNVEIVPNLWGLILGDSTLTRKTTAMRMMMELLSILDRDMVVATDGSVEGLLTGLEQRPNKTSIFFKDEVSGFFDSINKKDWLAGMPETLTALYDVPPFFTRRLRKETIRIESPVFIFFGGGVRDKVFENLKDDYVLSGFLPRFLVVSGDTDMSRIRRTGPPNEVGLAKRSAVVSRLADIYENYATEVPTHVGGQKVMLPQRITAKLTHGAWELYGGIEAKMLDEAAGSSIPNLALPTFERLSRSLLKMSVILASAAKAPQDSVVAVTKSHVNDAAWYVQQWGKYSIELVLSAGKQRTEKILERVRKAIEDHPGILRSTIMQHYHLSKREADEILSTLEDRQLVESRRKGKGLQYWAV